MKTTKKVKKKYYHPLFKNKKEHLDELDKRIEELSEQLTRSIKARKKIEQQKDDDKNE